MNPQDTQILLVFMGLGAHHLPPGIEIIYLHVCHPH